MAGDTDAEKISAYTFVATQLQSLSKMTETLVKLAKESGELMERNEVEGLIDKMVGIVADEVKDVEGYEGIIDAIVGRISELDG